MKNVTYGIVKEDYLLFGISRVSYGIAAYANADTDGTLTLITSVNDITSDRKRLTALIRECNRLELSPIHLNDVIEDFLAE